MYTLIRQLDQCYTQVHEGHNLHTDQTTGPVLHRYTGVIMYTMIRQLDKCYIGTRVNIICTFELYS